MVSDEMVEKALRAHHDHGLRLETYPPVWPYDYTERTVQLYTERMRAALEAVAPAIRAAAMEEAAKVIDALKNGVESERKTYRNTALHSMADRSTDCALAFQKAAAAIRAAKEAK